MFKFYKYSGAGNTFTIIDGRELNPERFKRPQMVHSLCLQYETDGLMILENPLGTEADFRMSYFNSDGSSGMMCGNGGRCIVAFADLVGVKPFHTADYLFEAPDGLHRAQILSHLGECKIVKLWMGDVRSYRRVDSDSWFVDTGARHLVRFVQDGALDTLDVDALGRTLRWDAAFAPEGVNVDFACREAGGALRVRTFEKGVEAETKACGTGITACAIAAQLQGLGGDRWEVQALEDTLSVEFDGPSADGVFSNVRLTGPTLCLGDLVE